MTHHRHDTISAIATPQTNEVDNDNIAVDIIINTRGAAANANAGDGGPSTLTGAKSMQVLPKAASA